MKPEKYILLKIRLIEIIRLAEILTDLTARYEGQEVTGFAKGDFDNDGECELATAFFNPLTNKSSIYISNANPHLTILNGTYDYSIDNKRISAMVSGDFDNDTETDLIVAANNIDSGGCVVYLINGPVENSNNEVCSEKELENNDCDRIVTLYNSSRL